MPGTAGGRIHVGDGIQKGKPWGNREGGVAGKVGSKRVRAPKEGRGLDLGKGGHGKKKSLQPNQGGETGEKGHLAGSDGRTG